MFYDLNVPRPTRASEDNILLATVRTLEEHGYKGLAITTTFDEAALENNKKGKSKQKLKRPDETQDVIPPPYDTTTLQTDFPDLHFYNRITIVISNSGNIQKVFQCNALKKYDIIAFQPANHMTLKALCGLPDVNVISFNPEARCNWTLNRKMYNQFLHHNVYFELTYSAVISDTTARKNLISLAHIYHCVGKSKNIIVTSNATSSNQIRGPYDIINLCLLFGLSEEQSKSVITRNCEKLLLQARKQQRGKCTLEMFKQKKLHLVQRLNKSSS